MTREPIWRRAWAMPIAVALAFAPLSAQGAGAPDAAALPTGTDTIDLAVAEAAARFGIPPAWIWAVMRAESAGDARAVSSAGAMGLMQIMPATWSRLSAQYGLGTDPFDRRASILAGAAYLRELHDRYGTPGFLAAYNAGPGRYEAWLAGSRALPAETRAYVAQLAPLIGAGGGTGARSRPAPIDPLAWTRAPIFAERAVRNGQDDAAPAPEHATDSSAVGAAPAGGALFVARAAPRP
jgi:hypothetical protein